MKKENSNLANSIKEGAFNNASYQMTLNYISPYALYLGASNKEVAYLSVLQSLGSALAQIPGARIAARFSRKAVWNISYFFGRFLWIFAILIMFMPAHQVAMLMILVFLIFFMNGIRNPAWSSLMADIVPADKRGKFFGKRNMVMGIAGLLAILASGIIISVFGFGLLFAASVIVSVLAIYFFNKTTEPPVRSEFHYRHSFNINPKNWLISMKANPTFVWFTFYMSIVSFAIAITSPFYTIIMIKHMNIGYLWYAIIITINILVTIISQPYWGRFSDRFGDRLILILTGTMVCFIPLLWIFASNVWIIIFVNIYDGFIFGGWSLVIFNFLIASVPAEKKTSYIANHAFMVGMATVAGALTGGLLAEFFESNMILGVTGIYVIFMISFIIRLFSLALMPKIHGIYKKGEAEPSAQMAWRLMVVEPLKNISNAFGYVYDFEWLKKKFRDAIIFAKEKTIWKLRMYNAGRN